MVADGQIQKVFRRGRREWRLDVRLSAGGREEHPVSGWRRRFALLGALSIPFFRAFDSR